jgi:hypothetical protein
MTRYFLHVHRAGSMADDGEGMELASLEDARREAVGAVRTILADEVLSGSIDMCGCVVITDETNAFKLLVPFTQAVEVRAAIR